MNAQHKTKTHARFNRSFELTDFTRVPLLEVDSYIYWTDDDTYTIMLSYRNRNLHTYLSALVHHVQTVSGSAL
jgi:hypothetical protein